MKKALLALSLLISTSAFAMGGSTSTGPRFSDDARTSRILNHPVLLAYEDLLKQVTPDCTFPSKDSDIMWMCTGAIPPVTEPQIAATGCGFALQIICPGKTIRVYGSEHTYYLNSPKPTKVQPFDAGTTIDGFNVQAN